MLLILLSPCYMFFIIKPCTLYHWLCNSNILCCIVSCIVEWSLYCSCSFFSSSILCIRIVLYSSNSVISFFITYSFCLHKYIIYFQFKRIFCIYFIFIWVYSIKKGVINTPLIIIKVIIMEFLKLLLQLRMIHLRMHLANNLSMLFFLKLLQLQNHLLR